MIYYCTQKNNSFMFIAKKTSQAKFHQDSPYIIMQDFIKVLTIMEKSIVHSPTFELLVFGFLQHIVLHDSRNEILKASCFLLVCVDHFHDNHFHDNHFTFSISSSFSFNLFWHNLPQSCI